MMFIVLGMMAQVSGAPTTSFYQYDGRGTVRMLTNSAGAVTDTYEYDAFGNLIASTGSTPNVYLYRGERYEAHLGLYYLRARWYNPVTGRFMTRDPKPGRIGIPRTLHAYLYASADGVNRIDPRGKEDLVEEEGAEEEAPAAEAREKQLSQRINCVLDTASSGLANGSGHKGRGEVEGVRRRHRDPSSNSQSPPNSILLIRQKRKIHRSINRKK